MEVSYNKLWKLLIDKKMKRIGLMEATGIGTSTLSKLGKDQYVSMEVLVKICQVLNCNIGDIVDVVKAAVPHEKID
ncbi:helix-turn-helix domain-containing protein [Anaeroselena agilis]|uniref:Helix-turn-helix transcriptional regulator n=1 Tax=Anaeroselena agilis TaxID=3063788 RepID=A0ABU3NTW0_9FIRM|nr:helix-turn-helix transcriptional regulator [Selenomonadales bacterium 4137-cl]